jgi:hypothetical protein
MKTCSKCKTEQPLSQFNKHTSTKDKLSAYCKTCIKLKVVEGIKDNQYKYQREWNEKKRSEGYFKQYNGTGYWNEYQKRRRKADSFYSLYINLRSRISNLLTGRTKSKNTQQIIGLPLPEFKQYLENLWTEGMNWNNYGYGEGKWVIDHKQPISSAQNETDIYTLNHYTNLQPMWWRVNLIKSNKAE